MNIPSKSWAKTSPPARILAIRLQAMGDLVITLPYLQQLRNTLPPNSRLDLLTREEVDTIPKNLLLFNHVYSIAGGRDLKKQLFFTFLMLPRLWEHRYDVVLDLQNNIISKIVRRAIRPKAWSEFDRFSPVAAGECTRLTIEAAGMDNSYADHRFRLSKPSGEIDLLKENGWDSSNELVVLNPAGAFPSRNWPIENYLLFANLWKEYYPNTQFLMLGTNLISSKAAYLKNELGPYLIDLTDKTTPIQAFAIVQYAKLVLSEDSGLMHMSWVSGIPTVTIFGSTWGARARPLGEHTCFLDSSDLPCGNCRQEICKYGDTHCLTRYTPQFIFEKALSLVSPLTGSNTSSE
ncbi:MAG: hypothetical protein C5B59_17125 [Bacteroidetes bacterium]|nr:MAG: hypothetical protein C5B59_17125 [Bacteroidota bacterium]